jgi:hypothetical protein
MTMTKYGYQPVPEQRIDTSGVHPPIDTWHFGGYQAAPLSGVAAWNDHAPASEAARAALTAAAGIEIPKAAFVLRVLIVYLAILVPLNWLVFWVLGRVEWAWIAAPIIAVIGAGAVIRLAQLDIGFARSRSEIAILEVQGGYDRGHLTRYTALYTSLSSSYRLAFTENSALALPFASSLGGSSPQQIAAINDVTFRIDREKSLAGVKVQSNSTGMVHSEQMFPLEGMLTLVGDEKRGWTVKNTSTLTLRDVGLIRRTALGRAETAYLAKLDPQTASPLAFQPLKQAAPTQDDSGRMVPPKEFLWLPEWDRSPLLAAPDPNSEIEKGQVRLNHLARLAVQRLRLGRGDVRLVAWTDELLAGMEIAPHAPQNKTFTLVLSHLVRSDLPQVIPDANVAEDYYEPPVDPEIESQLTEPETTTSGS